MSAPPQNSSPAAPPSIGLVTICWNAAATIARTFESVLSQGTLPAEYLVVDGGSTDGTVEIAAQWAPRFAAAKVSFRLIPQQRHPGQAGITSAWNQGLSLIRGEIIALLNADDAYLPGALATIREVFARESSTDAVAGTLRWCDAAGRTTGLFPPRPLSLLPYLMPLPHPACFFRRRVYEQLGFYDPRYRLSADYDFIWRCVRHGVRWHFLADELVAMQTGGAANRNRRIARRDTLHIARHYLPWYDLRPYIAYFARLLLQR